MKHIIGLTILLLLTITACAPQAGTVETGVETLQSTTNVTQSPVTPETTQLPAPQVTKVVTSKPTVTATSTVGLAAGQICYPSEFIPEMTAFFQDITGKITELQIAENQTSYSLELPMSTYVAYAYTAADPEMGGSFSQAVPCGLDVNCTDHSLISYEVKPGQTTENVDLCDWYSIQDVPPNPKVSIPIDPALAGLVYRDLNKGSIWQVDQNGNAFELVRLYQAAISPHGTQALFVQDDDIWLMDFLSWQRRNLTQTTDRLEFDPQWWAANPETIVFGSVPAEEDLGPSSGQMTLIHLDGSGYQVIEEDSSYGLPALNPDGKTIASDVAGQAYLYGLDGSKQLFDPTSFGLFGINKMASPSWSPDGKRIAWWAQGIFNSASGPQFGLVVFDLQKQSAQVIHPYTVLGGSGGWLSPAVWSPTGEWLAGITRGERNKADTWVMRVDGLEEYSLGSTDTPVWQPDGTQLAFTVWSLDGGPAQDAQPTIVTVGLWLPENLPLDPGSLPIEWFSFPAE